MKKQTARRLTQTPKKPRSLRKHVPALDANALVIALQQLETVVGLDRASKDMLADILRAASNPNAESLPVVLASLPTARQQNVGKTAGRLATVTRGITSRASAALADMSDAEWDALVNAANNE